MHNDVKKDRWKYKTDKADKCPFCGSKSISVCHAEVRYIGHNYFGAKKIKMKAYCMCNKCYAKGKPVTYIGYTDLNVYDEEHLPLYACGDEAIKVWNIRKPMERIVGRLEKERDDGNGGYSYGIGKAIEIVQTGGTDESEVIRG